MNPETHTSGYDPQAHQFAQNIDRLLARARLEEGTDPHGDLSNLGAELESELPPEDEDKEIDAALDSLVQPGPPLPPEAMKADSLNVRTHDPAINDTLKMLSEDVATERLAGEQEERYRAELMASQEVHEITNRFFAGEAEQKAPAFYASGTDRFSVAEVSIALRRGRKHMGTLGEDAFGFDPETGLSIIADGVSEGVDTMRGKGKGAEASRTAVELFADFYRAHRALVEHKGIAEGLIRFAERELAKKGILPGSPDFEGHRARVLGTSYATLPREIKVELIALSDAFDSLAREAMTQKAHGEFEGATTLLVSKTVRLNDGRMFEVIGGLGDGLATRAKATGERRGLIAKHSVLDYLRKRGFPVDQPNFTWKHPSTKQTYTRAQLQEATYGGIGAREEVFPNFSVMPINPGDIFILESDGQGDNEEAQDQYERIIVRHSGPNLAQKLTDITSDPNMDSQRDDVVMIAKRFPHAA